MRIVITVPFLLALAGSAAAIPSAQPKKALPFIEDDYSRALSEAKSRHKPLFIEAWAPW